MRKLTGVLICLWLSVLPVAGMAAEGNVGSVHNVTGKVVIVRSGMEMAATPGLRLMVGDILRAEPSGSVGVVLWDDSTVSMGPSSVLHLAEYRFKPAQKDFALGLRMVMGTFVYVPGRIAKLAPDSVRIETPAGLAKVEGTKLLAKVK